MRMINKITSWFKKSQKAGGLAMYLTVILDEVSSVVVDIVCLLVAYYYIFEPSIESLDFEMKKALILAIVYRVLFRVKSDFTFIGDYIKRKCN